jgi:hypothetical protein
MATSLKVDLHLLGPGQGGRTMPMRSGFRGTARIGRPDLDSSTGATVTFFACSELRPGESGPVRMALAREAAPVTSGTSITLYDGMRLIATGTVR